MDDDLLKRHLKKPVRTMKKETLRAPYWKEMKHKNKDFLCSLEKKIGMSVKLKRIYHAYSLLKCSLANNVPLPEHIDNKTIH